MSVGTRNEEPREVPPHPMVGGLPVLIGDRLILKDKDDYFVKHHGTVGTVIEVVLVQNPAWVHESGKAYEEKNEIWIELGGPFRSIVFTADDFEGRA